jgi:hypothetical protein
VVAISSVDVKRSLVPSSTSHKGSAGCGAARKAGFDKTQSLYTVRIEGPNKPGQGAKIVRALADKGLNLRGFFGAAIGKNFVAYIALDSSEDGVKAMRIIKGL